MRKLFFTFILFCSILYIGFIFFNEKLNLNNQSKLKISKKYENFSIKNKCDIEWIRVNNYFHIRKNLIIYYKDKNQLEIYAERHQNHRLNLTLILIIDSILIQLHNLNTTQMHQHSEYVFDLITAKANASFKSTHIHLLIKTSNNSMLIENINIRNYDELNLVNKSVLCSKVFYFRPEYKKNFAWWIELNKLNGYERLIFFNNSLPVEYDFILEKYSGFVESVQFNCIPNYIEPSNTNRSYITNFSQFKQLYNIDPLYYHMHFEFVTQNECYLNNINKYKYVNVLDQDEAILKRQIDEIQVINKTFFRQIEMNENYCHNQEWSDYFLALKTRISKNKDVGYLDSKVGGESYHFLMALYLNYRVVKKIFENLNIILNSEFINETRILIDDNEDYNFYGKKGVNFTLLIKNKEEFEYAKSMNNFFNLELKPYLKKNNNLFENVPENFARLFFVYGETTSWMCGKSFHYSKLSHWVSTHYPEKNNFFNMIWVPHAFGHVSHFRDSLKDLHNRNVSISDLNFDYNYFLCYFKPMIKNLKNIIFNHEI